MSTSILNVGTLCPCLEGFMLLSCDKPRLSSLFEAVHQYLYQEIFVAAKWIDAREAIKAIEQLNAHMPHGTLLPLLSCGVVGGDMEQAIPLAAAWVLYDIASDIFDDLQDGDGKDRPWVMWPIGKAMNVGLQLLGGAQQCLSQLKGSPGAQSEILAWCAQVLKQAAYNQNAMFANDPNANRLEAYWSQVVAKSGEIFACIMQSGGRVHTGNRELLNALYTYGLSVGIMIQLLDDCRDMSSSVAKSDLETRHYTLPILYSLSQTGHPCYHELSGLLSKDTVVSDVDVEQICCLAIDMGGIQHTFYLIHSYRLKAMQALACFPQGTYRRLLEQYVTSFDFAIASALEVAAN